MPISLINANSLSAGMVVQTQYCNSATVYTGTTQSAQTELSTDYRVAITPIYSNSLIILHYFVPMSPNGSWTSNWIVNYAAVRMPSGSALNTSISAISSAGPTAGSRKTIAGSSARSLNGYDQNDSLTWASTAIDLPGSTSAVQYGFTWGGEGAGPIIVNQTNNNNGTWGYSARVVIVAQEIKQ